jgi:hypothetical protein
VVAVVHHASDQGNQVDSDFNAQTFLFFAVVKGLVI